MGGDSTQQNPDDIVITLAIRSPLCRSGKGGLKDVTLDGLVFRILEQVRTRSKIDPELVEDICLGNVRTPKLSLARYGSDIRASTRSEMARLHIMFGLAHSQLDFHTGLQPQVATAFALQA